MTMMLVASANDAAEVLAVHVAGSESKFVDDDEREGQVRSGLTNTHAVDPHGLEQAGELLGGRPRRHRARADGLPGDARDRRCKKSVAVPRPRRFSVGLLIDRPAPRPLRRASRAIKTGFTNPAGYCFVGAAKRGDTELVGVVLGAGSNSARFAEMRRLLDWGFARYRTRQLVSDEKPIGVVAVGRSGEATVSVRAAESFSLLEADGLGARDGSADAPAGGARRRCGADSSSDAPRSTRAGSIVATVPLLAEAAVSDPSAARVVKVQTPIAVQPPAEGVWQRGWRAATHGMGMLSLRLLGSSTKAE